ncbi:MAG TPA: iron dicitrate transport regulator FecR [Ramlibacter sp.]|nr:iron dicitrate transport regulator FecR [Ramlibacter sp.]
MTQHVLQGRTESEVLWFRRRSFLQGAAAWTAMGGWSAAFAQQRTNVVDLQGDAQVNGQRVTRDTWIQSGDSVTTGPGSSMVFVVGDSAFQVRQNSRVVVERGATLNAVSVLRMVTGAVASVWGKGPNRQIVLPTLTAGIRGTGVYSEVFADQNNRGYFCNCYGVVEMSAAGERATSRSDYHQAFWGEVQPREGRFLTPAPAINHGDEELEYLARLVGQRTAWEVMGRRGVKDGRGYMEERPPSAHPAAMPSQRTPAPAPAAADPAQPAPPAPAR